MVFMSGTTSFLNTVQTFSAAKTFSAGLTVATANMTITDVDVVLSATTGTKIGTATTQKLGFYNKAPITQGAAVTDPTGGVVVDAECRTATTALNARLKAVGLLA